MDPHHLDELIELEEDYWWHVAKRQLVTSILESQSPPPGRLVEGGVGSCRNLLEFQRLGYEVTGLDILPAAVEHGRDRGLADMHVHDLSRPWPIEPNSVQAVVLLDVLEHVPDPVEVLRHVATALEPGGRVVITVPAYPWLYSEWDQSLGHVRRYTSSELKSQARQAALKLNWVTHWNALSLPAAVVVRGWQKLVPRRRRGAEFPRVSAAVNRLLLGLARWERLWLDRFGVPAGLSLVGVLSK